MWHNPTHEFIPMKPRNHQEGELAYEDTLQALLKLNTAYPIAIKTALEEYDRLK